MLPVHHGIALPEEVAGQDLGPSGEYR